MNFIWNDGGRAACGYVGTTGDCVTRAIAIATGAVYRDVYRALGEASLKSPRSGMSVAIAAAYLADQGWQHQNVGNTPFVLERLPKGVAIAHLCKRNGRAPHFCAIVDRVVHDTWNPADEENYWVQSLWTLPAGDTTSRLLVRSHTRSVNRQDELTQSEFDKILKRLRALDSTANNGASTEGEKRNALRMMQNLMLRHNLSREDLRDEKEVASVHFTRIAQPVNGRRACQWEKMLAWYVTREVFPMVQWYQGVRGHRTLFWFYGPVDDVQNSLALFRELLLTIATAAQLQYGGYVRGSGASYAEGYVAGLPRMQTFSKASETGLGLQVASPENGLRVQDQALMQARIQTVHSAAGNWLASECNIRLISAGVSGRHQHDQNAEHRGRAHGAQHEVAAPGRKPRITQR